MARRLVGRVCFVVKTPQHASILIPTPPIAALAVELALPDSFAPAQRRWLRNADATKTPIVMAVRQARAPWPAHAYAALCNAHWANVVCPMVPAAEVVFPAHLHIPHNHLGALP